MSKLTLALAEYDTARNWDAKVNEADNSGNVAGDALARELRRLLNRIMDYGLCHEDVTRKGESQPCGKTAVAVRIDPEDRGPYPVCVNHARGDMVPLTDLLVAIS